MVIKLKEGNLDIEFENVDDLLRYRANVINAIAKPINQPMKQSVNQQADKSVIKPIKRKYYRLTPQRKKKNGLSRKSNPIQLRKWLAKQQKKEDKLSKK